MNFINLVPENQKKILNRERMFLLLHGIIGMIVVVIAFNAIMLTGARFILINHYNNLKNDSALVNTELINLQNDIIEINKKINDAQKIQTSFVKFSDLSSSINKLAPKGIIVEFMHIDAKDNNLRINGISKNRELLLVLKDNLENSGFVKKLESPLSNLLEKENIEFRFSADLNKNIYTYPQTK